MKKIEEEKFSKDFNEILKLAYAKGRVKSLEEAFEEYDPEEEWHQGKIENVLNLNEDLEDKYSVYKIGDIVYVQKYYYKNGKPGRNHLFVIIGQNNIAVPIENFGMLISSKIEKQKYPSNKLLKKDSKNGLKKDSIVKTDHIYNIDDECILFKIGYVERNKVEEYIKEFSKNLKGE